MNKHLIAYVEQQNWTRRLFKEKEYDVNNLSAEDRAALLQRLESDLSPEALTRDGELRGAKLKAKKKMLDEAKAALEAMK